MIAIRWYGVMYVLAFWLAWALVPYLGRTRGVIVSRDAWTRIIAYGALGVLLGGRLGYAMLYDSAYFLANPAELLQIWHGGMSFHGGFIGAALGTWIAVRYFSPLLAIADILAVPAALGLALGRIGNITNGEFGVYPYFEAIGDILIAGICYLLLRGDHREGKIFALFLILTSAQRFLLEYIRPQEWSTVFGLSRGQAYTIPILVLGVILWRYANKR